MGYIVSADCMLSNAKHDIEVTKQKIEACMRCRGRNAISDMHSILIEMDMLLSEARCCISAYEDMVAIDNLD